MRKYIYLMLRLLFGGICILLLINLLANYWDTSRSPLGRPNSHSQLLSNNHHLLMRLPPSGNYLASLSGLEKAAVNSNSHRLPADPSSANIHPPGQGQGPGPGPGSGKASASSHHISNINISLNFSNATETVNSSLPNCQLPEYDGYSPFELNTTIISLDEVDAELEHDLSPGGFYSPKECNPQHHVAIVVPFRDRYAHLSVFLRNIHPFLMRQRIAYRIFIIEQTNGVLFNRAALMNIGFLEAMKLQRWDCFIFHDVDLLPLDNRNLYTCPRQPRHMSVAVDALSYRLPYNTIFGGVSAMTTEHFLRVNGFSNSFFGWGGEDDDMSNRLKYSQLYIARYPFNIARYIMLKHPKEKANPKRYLNLVNGIQKMRKDGLNSIKYDVYSSKNLPTYTWFLTELKLVDPNT